MIHTACIMGKAEVLPSLRLGMGFLASKMNERETRLNVLNSVRFLCGYYLIRGLGV